jgi:hypothetical protein
MKYEKSMRLLREFMDRISIRGLAKGDFEEMRGGGDEEII